MTLSPDFDESVPGAAVLEEERELARTEQSAAHTARAQSDRERARLAELSEMAVRDAAQQVSVSDAQRQGRLVVERALQEEQERRQAAESKARETEWALEKAEQLLRAHEETAQFYMAKAREEAAKASDAQATNTASAIELAEMAGAAHASAMGEVRSYLIQVCHLLLRR